MSINRIVGKGIKYGKIVKGALSGGKSEEYRAINFMYDLKEAIGAHLPNWNTTKKVSIIYEDINHGAQDLLFSKISLEQLEEIINNTLKEDGIYSLITLVSCGDSKRKHPHAFIIEKQQSSYEVYFLDPEYAVGKRDIFSPSITNGFKLSRDENSKKIHLIRMKTTKDNKDFLKLQTIYSTLKNNSQEDILSKYNENILMNYTYTIGGDFISSNNKDTYSLSRYTKAKLNSTSYIIELIGNLLKTDKFSKEDNINNIKFKSKLTCENNNTTEIS